MSWLFRFFVLGLVILQGAGAMAQFLPQPEGREGEEYPYQDEAETIAMCVSGELKGPPELARRISRELSLIRDTWQDSLPVVNMRYRPPWTLPRGWCPVVWVHVDDTAFAGIMASENPAWDSLNVSLGPDSVIYRRSPEERYNVQLLFSCRLHLHRLAESYVGFPGISRVCTEPIPIEAYSRPHFVRSEEGAIVRYFFKDYCQADVYHTYHYFLIDKDSVHYVGRHAECFEDMDYCVWAQSMFGAGIAQNILLDYAESLEANRPAWVDTARAVSGCLGVKWSFFWERDHAK